MSALRPLAAAAFDGKHLRRGRIDIRRIATGPVNDEDRAGILRALAQDGAKGTLALFATQDRGNEYG